MAEHPKASRARKPGKTPSTDLVGTVGVLLEAGIQLGLISAGTLLAAAGQWVLTGIVALAVLGVFLRFKRLRLRRRMRRNAGS